jgi:hypothetical protein
MVAGGAGDEDEGEGGGREKRLAAARYPYFANRTIPERGAGGERESSVDWRTAKECSRH